MLRFRPLLVPTLCLIPALALLLGLGVWQLERLQEKEALIASVEAGLSAPPMPLDQVLKSGIAGAEWRRVRISGHFLHDREQYLFAQGPGGSLGVQVITPLEMTDGRLVLVNRGFVPNALKDPVRRTDGQTPGEVSVTGIVRISQQPGLFTPAPDPKARLWFVKDVPAIAKAARVAALPVLIEADAAANKGGWPLGGQTRVDFPNDHLQYAITWFGLALALLAVYFLYHHSRGRLTGRAAREF
jgi:surfeit locus 1 family protein